MNAPRLKRQIRTTYEDVMDFATLLFSILVIGFVLVTASG